MELWKYVVTIRKPREMTGNLDLLAYSKIVEEYSLGISDRIAWCIEQFGEKPTNTRWDFQKDCAPEKSIFDTFSDEQWFAPNVYFLFRDGGDALLFKLTWGGEI